MDLFQEMRERERRGREKSEVKIKRKVGGGR